jgi:hypothetical protein
MGFYGSTVSALLGGGPVIFGENGSINNTARFVEPEILGMCCMRLQHEGFRLGSIVAYRSMMQVFEENIKVMLVVSLWFSKLAIGL